MTDVSVVMGFHAEGRLAHRSLRAMDRCLAHAIRNGISVELVAVLDGADSETRRVVASTAVGARIVCSDAADAGLARNIGVAAATGGRIATCDGDDYLSENWISEAFSASVARPDGIHVPEYVVNFGDEESFVKQTNTERDAFPATALLSYNPWSTAWALCPISVFREHPYEATRAAVTGFGYEDWHWRCGVTAQGHPHLTVPGTAGFYRRRSGGRLTAETLSGSVLKPSPLFDVPSVLERSWS